MQMVCGPVIGLQTAPRWRQANSRRIAGVPENHFPAICLIAMWCGLVAKRAMWFAAFDELRVFKAS